MGRMSTSVAVRKHLASLQRKTKGKAAISDSTLKGYRSTLRRVEKYSRYLPATKEAVEKAIGHPGESSINKRISRYDCINRFFKDVADSGIPNPCDEISRPRKSDEIRTQELVDQYLELREISAESDAVVKNDRRVLKRLVDVSPTLPASVTQIGKALGPRKGSLKDPEEGYAQTTRRLHYTLLHAFFEWRGVQDRGIPNPLASITKPRVSKTERRIFTDEEMGKLVDAAENDMDRSLILFLFDSGVRIGEVPDMTVSDINKGRVQVKGKSGPRSASVSPEMEEILRGQADENGNIWWDERGPLSLSQLTYRYTRTVKAAGLIGKKLGPHTARHTFATDWLRAHAGEFELQKQLGHANISTTHEYSHLVDNDVAAAHKMAGLTARLGLFGDCESTRGTNEDEIAVPDVLDPNGAPLVVSRAEIAAMVAAEVRRERADEALRQREARTQVSVERLVQEKCMELEGGRPSITLPAPVARMILDDHKAGHSLSAIWRKYSVYYPFSRAWLTNALADGRLEQMAERDSETP